MTKTHPLFDLQISCFDSASFDLFLNDILKTGKNHHLITINPEYLVRAESDPTFKKLLEKAHSLIPDGIGLIWAAHFLDKTKTQNPLLKFFHLAVSGASLIFSPQFTKTIFPARLSGADFWLDICQKCEANHQSIFLHLHPKGLSTFDQAKTALLQKFPNLQIFGSDSDADPLPQIQASKPAVIFSGFGVPHQDIFLNQILPQCSPETKLGIGVGASFDFLTGTQTRAPKIMQNLGLEWLWRFLTRPKRVKRIWKATFSFITLTWKESKKPI